jgi:hypothetical protein
MTRMVLEKSCAHQSPRGATHLRGPRDVQYRVGRLDGARNMGDVVIPQLRDARSQGITLLDFVSPCHCRNSGAC